MKNIISAVALMSFASFAFAAPTVFEPGTPTEKQAVPTTYTYTVEDAAGDRLFVKNQFDFTLSANVIVDAAEDPNGRFMVVGAANTNGRNVYTGSSDGGSVSSCQDPLTADQAKADGAMATALSARLAVAGVSGCAAAEEE